jgi:hypothetical protein
MWAVLLFLCAPTFAQEGQKLARVEFFAGYQLAHVYPNANGQGWNFAMTGNMNRAIGFTGDFSGSYERGSALYTYMVGPTLSARTKWVTPFVHALVGGGHADGINAFAIAVGGGLDVNAGEHFAIRVIQADWMSFRRAGASINGNVRASAGIVFRF